MSASALYIEAEMRDAERHPVRLDAEARHSATMRVPGVISDLSETGFRFESPIFIPTGTRLKLRIKEMRGFDAFVVRRGEGHYGCAFAKPLYGPILRALTEETKARRP